MKHTYGKAGALLLAAALILSLLTACAGGEEAGGGPAALGVADAGAPARSVGEFTTRDIHRSTVTQAIFGEHRLTMVNVFATWCTPCVEEMPDLERLHQQVKDRDVGVVGVVLDVLDENGRIIGAELETAQQLVKETGVTYPVLLPDSGNFGGRLTGIEAIPETFFVDRQGNIVGGSYSGSGGLEDWLQVVEQELARLPEEP